MEPPVYEGAPTPEFTTATSAMKAVPDSTRVPGEAPGPPRKGEQEKISVLSLFRFCTPLDALLVTIGLLCAAGEGVLIPCFTLLIGDMIDSFKVSVSETSEGLSYAGGDDFKVSENILNRNALILLCLGLGSVLLRFIFVSSLSFSAARQGLKIRQCFIESALCQDLAWLDGRNAGELATKLTDVGKIQEGIGEHIGILMNLIATLTSGVLVAFITGWKLTLIMLSVLPIHIVMTAAFSILFHNVLTKSQESYANAGKVASEFISGIRTVTTLGIQVDAVNKYEMELVKSLKFGYRKGFALATSLGAARFVSTSVYALASWYSFKMTEDAKFSILDGSVFISRKMTPGDVVTVLFSVLLGVSKIAFIGPSVGAFLDARSSAAAIFSIIDKKPVIDVRCETGEAASLQGNITFQRVSFSYPTRSESHVLKSLSLIINAGESVAIVGASGCGKSTIVSLLERFYDASNGQIFLDGIPITSLNVRCLRNQIGVVSQEPALFSMTIKENIALGAVGSVTQEQIEEAATMAGVHQFVMQLPLGYETLVGQRGSQLSGGQKQRIAIARTLIRRPKIMIFDEATSALDSENEREVQDAIKKASKGVTCLMIAHRLSTIINADKICVLNNGSIAEIGRHSELMEKQGLYYNLFVRQSINEHRETIIIEKQKNSIRSETMSLAKIEKTSVKPTIATMLRAMSFMKRDWLIVVIGAIGSILDGVLSPSIAIVESEVIAELFYITNVGGNDSKHHKKVTLLCCAYLIIGVAALLFQIIGRGVMEVASSRLIKYLRLESFRGIMRQDLGWFDERCHSTGILTTRLANDVTTINGITGSQLGGILGIVSSVIAGVCVSFSGNWKIALLCCSLLPVILFVTAVDLGRVSKKQPEIKADYEKAGHIASEALENPKTVAITGTEMKFARDHLSAIQNPMKKGRKTMLIHAAISGATNATTMWIPALATWYGGKLISSDSHIKMLDITKAMMGVLLGTMSISYISPSLSDFSRAFVAASHIFEIIDRKPLIPSVKQLEFAPPGDKQTTQQHQKEIEIETPVTVHEFKGDLQFNSVCFEYPIRPGIRVLNRLSFHVKPGMKVALVGKSGCGKSTIVSLLERFYNPSSGDIFVDGRSIMSLDASWIRSKIGMVGQEPDLFTGTVRENIAFGKPGASDEEIHSAAKAAGAHNFIISFPKGYDTIITERGANMSGGQKQRIAIARALIRNPKILILDEATSALDSESEAFVQGELEKVFNGRTTFIIAHRLSTISMADMIVVLENGEVIQSGTHNELIATEGLYHDLISIQLKQ